MQLIEFVNKILGVQLTPAQEKLIQDIQKRGRNIKKKIRGWSGCS